MQAICDTRRLLEFVRYLAEVSMVQSLEMRAGTFIHREWQGGAIVLCQRCVIPQPYDNDLSMHTNFHFPVGRGGSNIMTHLGLVWILVD